MLGSRTSRLKSYGNTDLLQILNGTAQDLNFGKLSVTEEMEFKILATRIRKENPAAASGYVEEAIDPDDFGTDELEVSDDDVGADDNAIAARYPSTEVSDDDLVDDEKGENPEVEALDKSSSRRAGLPRFSEDKSLTELSTHARLDDSIVDGDDVIGNDEADGVVSDAEPDPIGLGDKMRSAFQDRYSSSGANTLDDEDPALDDLGSDDQDDPDDTLDSDVSVASPGPMRNVDEPSVPAPRVAQPRNLCLDDFHNFTFADDPCLHDDVIRFLSFEWGNGEYPPLSVRTLLSYYKANKDQRGLKYKESHTAGMVVDGEIIAGVLYRTVHGRIEIMDFDYSRKRFISGEWRVFSTILDAIYDAHHCPIFVFHYPDTGISDEALLWSSMFKVDTLSSFSEGHDVAVYHYDVSYRDVKSRKSRVQVRRGY